MIQIIAPRGPLQEMLLLELQGKVVIPPKLLEEERERQRIPNSSEEEVKACSQVTGGKRLREDGECGVNVDTNQVVEVPLGCVVWDSRNETRCSLQIGTVEVSGSYGKRREPLLVLKRCVVGDKTADAEGAVACEYSESSGSQCCLLQEWLQEHPEELTLDATVRGATVPRKVYELVGVVERYIHLNSKPLRRFV
ncbi:Ctf8, putative [Trypanosoma equiperdum]|uniref:Ctf8 n=2 Tax=Trypanozoon TaxID=39700 RepID=Q57ZG2_TRYB2|nr:hypothetical protein, conserved [Trypanosoma brucei brucei TREU927]AAX79519.1 hypothetical protein, conserved [Trypanosoma brucei]AAZ12591.1 hypothetical protein, conserved [Trypanosoma brucei brucei TREU927]SCU66895.1 Ctf8, putative [Trypanosoma equiperdum]